MAGGVDGEAPAVHRGRRAEHAEKGSPGTWEVSFSPAHEDGAGAVEEVALARRSGGGLWERTAAGAWYRGTKATK